MSSLKREFKKAAELAVREEAAEAVARARAEAIRLHGEMRTEGDITLVRDAAGFYVQLEFDAVYRSTGERTAAVRTKLLEHEMLRVAATLERSIGRRVSEALR